MLFPRVYYIGHPVDDTDKFEKTMSMILGRDDPNKLHEYVNGFVDNYHYPALLDLCLDWESKKCALYIIQGKLRHGFPNLACDHSPPKPDVPVLYQVINLMCEPNVFHLLLYDCKAANQVNQPYLGLLPLHWLLGLLEEMPPLSDWSPGKPLSTIIDSLFLPEIVPKLECARMLAKHTHSLDQIALGYFLNGEIIPLAALLLVAPFTKGDFEIIKSYTSSVDSQAIHDQSVTPSTYCAVAALLSIFEKDGNMLTSKFNNLQKGIVEAATDVELTDIDSNSCHPEMLKSICERPGLSQTNRKSLFPSVKSVKELHRAPEIPVSDDDTVKLIMWMETFCEGLGDEGMDGGTQDYDFGV